MFGLFRRKAKSDTASLVNELQHVFVLVSKLNIPVVADDFDSGYDMAIDEVLDIIDARIRFHLNPATEENTEDMS